MEIFQSEVDEMRSEMVKSDRLEIWSKYMEGATTPVLTILDDRMINTDIGGRVTNNIDNDTPFPEIIALEKKWER